MIVRGKTDVLCDRNTHHQLLNQKRLEHVEWQTVAAVTIYMRFYGICNTVPTHIYYAKLVPFSLFETADVFSNNMKKK